MFCTRSFVRIAQRSHRAILVSHASDAGGKARLSGRDVNESRPRSIALSWGHIPAKFSISLQSSTHAMLGIAYCLHLKFDFNSLL
jgi:hypothetical protein